MSHSTGEKATRKTHSHKTKPKTIHDDEIKKQSTQGKIKNQQ